jgi:hypothetical protein
MAWNDGITIAVANKLFNEVGINFEKAEDLGIYYSKKGESAIAQASTLIKTAQITLIELVKKEEN